MRPPRVSRISLGNFGRSTDDELNPDAGMPKHGDQRIDAKSIDLASHEVADPGLAHSKQLCRLRLGEAASLDQLAEPNHQIRPDLEILRLLARESEVAEHVAA